MKQYLIIIAALAVPVLTAVLAQDPGGPPLVGQYNFKIEIGGVNAGAFNSVEGISGEIEVVETPDTSSNFVLKRPGRAKFGNIVLKRGYTATDDLFIWWKETALQDAGLATRPIVITLIDSLTNNPVQTWSFFECWPSKWKVPTLDGKGNDVVVEEVTFVVEDMKME